MNQHNVMVIQADFESEKNKKAFTYTVIICGVLLLLFFFITWPILEVTQPVAQDLIEINLGNNDEGFGETQPLVKGEMSPTQESAAQPQHAKASKAEPAEDPQPDDNAENDAAPVTKSIAVKPVVKPKDVLVPAVTKTVKVKAPAPVVMPAPKPQKPIATYKGPGNGKGNGATEDKGYRNQGNNPNGKGDAGDPSGKPDSYGNSPGGRSGVSVIKGTRPLNLGQLKFEDDFNENSKIYLDIKYSSSGSTISSSVSRGTTTTNTNNIAIAKRRAAELKFPPSAEGGITTILFNLKVN